MTTETAIAIAMIGALAGFLGALGGSWISARATKEATGAKTIAAVIAIEDALYVIYDFDYQLHGPEEDQSRLGPLAGDAAEWSARHDEYEGLVSKEGTGTAPDARARPIPRTRRSTPVRSRGGGRASVDRGD